MARPLYRFVDLQTVMKGLRHWYDPCICSSQAVLNWNRTQLLVLDRDFQAPVRFIDQTKAGQVLPRPPQLQEILCLCRTPFLRKRDEVHLPVDHARQLGLSHPRNPRARRILLPLLSALIRKPIRMSSLNLPLPILRTQSLTANQPHQSERRKVVSLQVEGKSGQ